MRRMALLVASFGTAHADTRRKTIVPLEEEIRETFPERRFYRCFTSPTVRRLMERREGICVDGPPEALQRMAADGMEDILIFATHVIPGIESERIARQTEEFQAEHPEIRVRLTKPLLSEDGDYRACAEILMEEYGEKLVFSGSETSNRGMSGSETSGAEISGSETTGPKEEAVETPDTEKFRREADGHDGKSEAENALIFFGHGTPHTGDACYERLERAMRRQWEAMTAETAMHGQWEATSAEAAMHGQWEAMTAETVPVQEGKNDSADRIYVVTVEGSRTVADILPELKIRGVKKAFLIPFLLTAGEHVMHDMAGDEPGSAKSLLGAEGIEAVPVKKGLGEYERLRKYYVQRCEKAKILLPES